MLSKEDLSQLMATEASPAVSIFMPTHTAGPEIQQDPVRLRNLINVASDRLRQQGCGTNEVTALMKPVDDLLMDNDFWRHQQEGLAIFTAPGFFRCDRLPLQFDEEEVIVGRKFHITPLLPLLDEDVDFHLLTVSANRAKLFRCNRAGLTPIEDVGLPQGVGEVYGETDYENIRHAGGTGRPRTPYQGDTGTQNIGESPEDYRKEQFVEYLKRVSAAVEQCLAGGQSPLILAAHPEVRGHFRQQYRQSNLLDETIDTNPDALPPAELHQRALAIVAPLLTRRRDDALEHFNALAGDGNQRAATKVEDIVKAARYGRVDTLFLAHHQHLWGRFDEQADKVVAHGQPVEDDEDLLDYAACQTLMQGGHVTLLDKGAIPRGGLMAAILRY